MEDQFRTKKPDSIIISLVNCDTELNRAADGLIHIFMRPVDMPIIIDFPWREEDLRVMLSAWLAGLRGPEENGKEITPG